MDRNPRGASWARSWSYRPSPSARDGRDEAQRMRTSLLDALRAGEAGSIRFGILARGGPTARLWLTVSGPAAGRWVDRCLARAYEPGQWAPTSVPTPSPGWRGLRTRRSTFEPATPPSTPEPSAALRPLVAGLSGRSGHSAVSIEFDPVATRPPAPSSRLPSRGVDRGVRGTYSATGSHVPGLVERPGAGPGGWWRATFAALDPDHVARSGDLARLLEVCSRSIDGTGARFDFAGRMAPCGVPLLLRAEELAAWLPGRDLAVAPDRTSRAPLELVLGWDAGGETVAWPIEPTEGRHLAVLGETGMGKSSLLAALSVRAARVGHLLVLDPIGETAATIRRALDRAGAPTVWIAPGADPPGINALAAAAEMLGADRVGAERRLRDLVIALRRVRAGRYADSGFWGPRLEEMLLRALRAAAAWPGATLADAHALLASQGRSHRIVPPGSEEAARELFDRIRERPEDADGARRLLFEVVRDPTLERMLCDRTPARSVASLVRGRASVLISGEAVGVGESTARYLLAVYLALLWPELLGGRLATKTFVVLDEAQWFAHESLAEMLRLARRQNVHVVLATQALASLPPAVSEAVWTNVADFVAFRGLPEEAREFARAAPGVPAERLLAMGRGRAAVLVGKGQGTHWVRTPRLLAPRRGPVPGPPAAPVAPVGPGEARSRGDLLDAIYAGYVDGRSGGLVAIPLEELRARWPDRDLDVRRVGARLGRSGALQRTERTVRGPVWWIDVARWPGREPVAPVTGGPGASSVPQPS